MSDLDKDAFADALKAHYETDCGNSPCNASDCKCLRAVITTYIAHVAASPADLRAVLAYDAGLAEGRRQGLERAAADTDCGCKGRAAVLAATTSAERSLACGREPCAAAMAADIRALIKETDGE